MNVEYEFPFKKFEKVTITLTAEEADDLFRLLNTIDLPPGSSRLKLYRALENPQP